MNECMNGCMNEWMGEVPRHTPYFSMQQQQHPHPVPPPDAPLPEDTPPSFPEEEEDEVYSGEEEKYNSPAEEEEEEEGEEEHDDEGDDVWDEAEDEAESGPIHEEQMTSSETQESPERAAGTPVVVDLCKDIWKDGTAFQQATAEIGESHRTSCPDAGRVKSHSLNVPIDDSIPTADASSSFSLSLGCRGLDSGRHRCAERGEGDRFPCESPGAIETADRSQGTTTESVPTS